VGFAAINLTSPPPGPPPPPPGSVYRYDYARMPQNRRDSGLALLFLGLVAFVVVLLIAGGGMIALGLGPFARPTPTLIAQASPTPVVSVLPTASAISPSLSPSPQGSAGPTATPIPSGDVTDALLSHIPAPIRSTCLAVAGSDTIVAIATCSADDGNIQLIYFQYDSYDSMFTTYDSYRLASQIEADTGDCNDHNSWPAENGFNIAGQLAGRWLCTEAHGSTQLYWTDNRLNILSQATQTVPDYARLIDFWVHESGPDL
jgi:hypothetical protein